MIRLKSLPFIAKVGRNDKNDNCLLRMYLKAVCTKIFLH